MRRLITWFESRTGLRDIIHHALYENIPSGARWRYITGSMLVFAFSVQAITGIFLWMAYSPSSQTAYESVHFIQHEMTGGWLVRGVHHFMAQAMVVVMALHMLQVIVDGAYRAPRELNYWLGLVLMQLVMGLGLTGYLLPWDQKGYWATNVATNLATLVPFVGKELQQLAVGGNEYGHHTLTRFFALHTGVLPGALILFLILHIAAFRKHGIMAKITPGRADQYFWPHQVLLDAVGCLVLLGVVLLCVVHFDVQGLVSGNLPAEHRGAELGAPADPSEAYSAARPEWYYLFLFQLLKYFPGTLEIIGALVIPGVVMTVLALAPIFGRSKLGHRFNVAFILFLLAGAAVLTGLAWNEDANNPDFQIAKHDAAVNAERTLELINRRQWVTKPDGTSELSDRLLIQKQGAVYLLRNDPGTQGPKLFKQHCASCHSYINPSDLEGKTGPYLPILQSPKVTADGKVLRDAKKEVVYDESASASGAPNLFGFGSRAWIRGFLHKDKISAISFGKAVPSTDAKTAADAENPDNHKRPLLADYFGNTHHKTGRMAQWVKSHASYLSDDPKKNDEPIDAIVAALSAQARLRWQSELDARDSQLITKGIGLIQQNCATGCHRMGDFGQLGLAPDLTGYGSYEWMLAFVSDPTHQRFYRQENDRMPSFAQDLSQPATHAVSVRELSLIVDWLRGDYYHPDDKQPVLPHTEEFARATVATARTLAEPRSAVVGAPAPAPETKTQRAERLFVANCAACHSHTDASGQGIAAKNPSAPNLRGFASRVWLSDLLDPQKIVSDHFFGKTAHAEGDMVNFVRDNLTGLADADKQKLARLVSALSAEAALPAQAEDDKKATDDGTITQGKTDLGEGFGSMSCLDCHKFHETDNSGEGPDLTGYGSKDWLVRFITDPANKDCYADGNDRMPPFGVAGPGPKKAILSSEDIALLAQWLRGEKLE